MYARNLMLRVAKYHKEHLVYIDDETISQQTRQKGNSAVNSFYVLLVIIYMRINMKKNNKN
jgi:hypothetical protein